VAQLYLEQLVKRNQITCRGDDGPGGVVHPETGGQADLDADVVRTQDFLPGNRYGLRADVDFVYRVNRTQNPVQARRQNPLKLAEAIEQAALILEDNSLLDMCGKPAQTG